MVRYASMSCEKLNRFRFSDSGTVYILSEFMDFIRPKICLCITSLAISGYMLFNPLSPTLFFVALCAFFVTCATYSYNMITDGGEDVINHKKLNYFVLRSDIGKCLVVCFVGLGIVSSLFLSRLSVFIFLSAIITGLAYSRYRVKDMFPLKNLYTAVALILSFFGGALNVPLSKEIVLYSIPMFLILFAASLMSDLRDYEGDRLLGIRTLPVVLGYGAVCKVLYGIISGLLFFIVSLNMSSLYVLIPFTISVLMLLRQNKTMTAHLYLMMALMFLPLGVILTI